MVDLTTNKQVQAKRKKLKNKRQAIIKKKKNQQRKERNWSLGLFENENTKVENK